MIRGSVTAQREAVVSLRIIGPASEIQLETVVDTGFNDFLTLPPNVIDDLDLSFAAPMLATLADGSVVETSSYRATVLWDGEYRDVFVLAFEGGALIGMSLLYGFDLHVECVDEGIVTINKRSGNIG
jgi:clan AA aspartic protease